MSEYIVNLSADWANKQGEKLTEIVRCRDCVNPSFDEFGGGWCNENCREVKPWDYCAWAKRKEGGE